MNISIWSNNWSWSDWVINEWFSYLSADSNNTSTILWEIDSLTNRIPKEWEWDIDRMLSAEDSINFNTMDYDNSEIFLLYRDNGEGNPYSEWNLEKSKPDSVSGIIRLPSYLYNTFGDLNINLSLLWSGWSSNNNVKNDAIVDRQVMWNYKSGHKESQFNIIARQNAKRNWGHDTRSDDDTVIRESDINPDRNSSWYIFNFGNYKKPHQGNWNNDTWTIISPIDFNSWTFRDISFRDIFRNDDFNQIEIRFSLLNQLKNEVWLIYPFLEYFVEFDGDSVSVPDKYTTINAIWNYGDYQIHLIIQKPNKKESVLQSFTTIF